MKKILIILIIFFVLSIACNNGKKTDKKIVVCPDEPMKGIVKLKVEKVLTIDSLTLDKEKPPIFNTFIKDKNGSIYVSNVYPEIAIYKFAKNGDFLKKFLSKGEGPGELRSLQFLQYINNSIIVGSQDKIIEYDLDGNHISEKRFKKLYQAITMIDKQYFIANQYKTKKNDSRVSLNRTSCIINKNDDSETVTLFETDRKNIGQTIVGEGETAFSFSLVGITADYISRYNENYNLIYQCISDEPNIYIRNSSGDLIKIVKTNFKKRIFTEEDKREIMANFVNFPDDKKNMVRKNLPEKMLAIKSLQLLPKGYFAVFFFKELEKHEIRIFDKDGQFQFIVELPKEISGRSTIFIKNGLACIERVEDRDLYVEYKIENLPEIFSY